MTKIKMVKMLAMPSVAVMLVSCVKAPVDLTLNDKIEISESQVQEIADDIYEKLAEIDFATPPPPTVNPDECSTAYKLWLRKQFDRGLVPKDIITAAEYGESSSNPNIHECRAIDFQQEYENALDKSVRDEKRKRKAIIFGMNQFREKLVSNKCTENFLDLDKEKIEIVGIDLLVHENTLSVDAPKYKLYSSYEDDSLKDEIEETMNAEASLVKEGVLMLLGETRPIQHRFTGRVTVDLNTNADAFFEAEGPVVSMDGTMFAIPGPMASVPEVSKVGNKEYFIVPKGRLKLTLATQIEVKLSSADAKCAFDQLKASIREDEKKRASSGQ